MGMKIILISLFFLVCLLANAAQPSFQDLNTNQFGVAGNKVSVASGALLTNINIKGYLIVNTNLLVATNGQVGIGTASPGKKLDVIGAAAVDGLRVAHVGDNYPSINFERTGGGSFSNRNWMFIMGSGGEYIIQDATAGVNRLAIKPAGDYYYGPNYGVNAPWLYITNTTGFVGIGTATPTAKLDIYGGELRFNTDTTGYGRAYADGGGATYSSVKRTYLTGGLGFSAFIRTAGQGTYIHDFTNANDSAAGILDVNSGQFRISAVGSVGIGTTNPTTRLHVVGTNLAAQVKIQGPTVNYASVNGGQLVLGATTGVQGSLEYDGSAGLFTIENTFGTGAINFKDGTVENMRITGAGNVGIGTNAPDLKLVTVGSGHFTVGLGVGTNSVGTRGRIDLQGSGGGSGIYAAGSDVLTISAAGSGKSITIQSDNLYLTSAAGGSPTIHSGTAIIMDASRNLRNIATATAVLMVTTNGIASYSSNGLAGATVTVGASPSSFTNTLTKNIVVYVDGIGVVGTLGINGATVFSNIQDNTIILQPGDYMTFTYASGLPTAVWRPF